MRRGAWCAALLVSATALMGVALPAQVLITPSPAPPPRAEIFQRAQRLVNDGNGAAGRALVDSLLNATEPRSADEAEVLFWRATLAESWDQAQRDYLRVMLEHERSPFAASAMLRLAQGEVMRADTAAALRYLDRLLAERPNEDEAQALRARLRPVVVSTVPATDAVPPSEPASVTPPRETAAGSVTPPIAAPATPAVTPPSGAAARGTLVWSVQIAAFPTAAEARRFAEEMRGRGYDVRVDGSAAPFRVRFGYYPTRSAAAAAMQAYKDRERGDAFLAQVPQP